MKVLLGVTGSVAAKLTSKMVHGLLSSGHEVKVVSTERGLFFFQRYDIRDVYHIDILTDKDEWPEDGYHRGDPIGHIDLGLWADLMLIAPLSADTLSDIANGKCDKFLTSIARAWPREKPIVIAPAMNTRMWTHPVTAEHISKLRDYYKISMVGPIDAELACGEVGMGAMAKITDIVNAVNSFKI